MSESWLPVPGYPYHVSTLGNVRRDAGPYSPDGRLLRSTNPKAAPLNRWHVLTSRGKPPLRAKAINLLTLAKTAPVTPATQPPPEHWQRCPTLPIIEASSYGRLRYYETGDPIEPFFMRKWGFLAIKVNGRPVTVHNLIARTFLPDPQDDDVKAAFLDGDRHNLRPENLYWDHASRPAPHDPKLPYIPMPDGQILDRATNLPLPTTQGPHGIRQVTVEGVRYAVHQLVAKAHVPNPRGCKQVKHLDGNKLNNSADNLQWVKPSDDPNRMRAALWALKKRAK